METENFALLFEFSGDKKKIGHLHGTSFVDCFAGVAATKEKTVGATIGAIGSFVSGVKIP